jgi:predicted metal-dependent HD superfamily phosphohydrolase
MEQPSNFLLSEVEAHVANIYTLRISARHVYHDYQHTRDVVEAVRQIADGYALSDKELEIVQIAAWFHDTGHDQGSEGHEERSCQYASEFLNSKSYPETDTTQVCAIILSTKFGQKPENLLQQIMCDADLSHLGSKLYWDRCWRVRQELMLTRNQVMSEKEWVDAELEFLFSHAYYTQVASDLYDKRKQKNIRQLMKHKLRLNPDTVDIAEVIDEEDAALLKKKKKKNGLPNDDAVLKQVNLGRGVETMYRTTYRTHVNLSSIADNKANIMLSINAIIISIVITNLVPRIGTEPRLFFPTALLLVVCLTALVFAILSTRPKITKGEFTREDIEQKRANLLFFGNFYKMDLDVFHWGMTELIKDSDFLYSSMTRDLYYLGVVLAQKYKFLRICYNIFMFGLIASVLAFGIVYLLP